MYFFWGGDRKKNIKGRRERARKSKGKQGTERDRCVDTVLVSLALLAFGLQMPSLSTVSSLLL